MDEYSREPCPHRIYADAGSAFAMGLIGGSIFHGIKGFSSAPRGQGLINIAREVRMRSPVTGSQFAAWGGMFSVIDCGLVYMRRKEDPFNSIAAGGLTGGLLCARMGWKTALVSAGFGAVILTMIEGANCSHCAILHRSVGSAACCPGLETAETARRAFMSVCSSSKRPSIHPLAPILLLCFFLSLPSSRLCTSLQSSSSSSSGLKRIKTSPGGTKATASVNNNGGGNRMCPLNEHVVCNEISELQSVRCVCTMFGSDSPAPEQSCSNLLNSSLYVEASSVKLRISDSFFPPTPPSDEHSAATTTGVAFQNQQKEHFVPPLALPGRQQRDHPDDLIDADTVVRRIKGMKELQHSDGLEIMHVEKVNELIPVEVDVDNSRLVIQAIVVAIFILLTSLCGCWLSCRKRRPEDEGYEDVVQQPDKV
uniref:Uncharacterized protein n=1 Tax=Globodera rostochiensis TaxID=31243 RepID=A0A914H2M2_GLORO